MIASSNVEVVQKCDIVFTSLPLSEIWVEVVEREFLPHTRQGQIFIDMGTVTPPETRRLYDQFKAKGTYLIDSPVSNAGGGNNKFYIFIGGDKEIVDQVWPLYETLGVPEHTVYCGPTGSGQVVKGINQLGIGLINAAAVEIIAFGVHCGVDPEKFARAVGAEDAVGWRGLIYETAMNAKSGKIEQTSVKHGQLMHYIKEAHARNFELPLSRALFEFLKDSPETIKDANRKSPSYWNELMKINK
jgi:3-hydroxyisobutyrate dehydrogenase-like beta-hydroxyacid dehydrogenase